MKLLEKCSILLTAIAIGIGISGFSKASVPAEAADSVNYEAVYSDFLYHTLLPEKGEAAAWTNYETSLSISQLCGVVSSCIYDFGQDGVKELVVVTREKYSGNMEGWLTSNFCLYLYRADSSGNVQLLDKESTCYFLSGSWFDGKITTQITISGNAVYLEALEHRGSSGIGACCHRYAAYDAANGRFDKYELYITMRDVYDISSTASDSLEPGRDTLPAGTALYSVPELNSEYYEDYPVPYCKYSSLSAVNTTIAQELKNHHVSLNSASVSIYHDSYYLRDYAYLNLSMNTSAILVDYTASSDNDGERINSSMIDYVKMETTTTTKQTTTTTTKRTTTATTTKQTTTTTTSTTEKETTTMTSITETTPAYSESIVLSIRPEKTSYTVAANNNVIYLQKENLPDTMHLGVYIDKYDSACTGLKLKLCSDTDKITFIKDTFCNPSAYRYDEARTYTLSDGTTFSTKFQPYALGRINSAGNYDPGCFVDKADFDSTGKEMTFTWNYDNGGYDTSGNRLWNALLLTNIPDELSFIEFDVKLDQTISPGSYQLYFYTNFETYNDSTYIVIGESIPDEQYPGKYQSYYSHLFPAVRNLSIVILPEETSPETTSTTTTAQQAFTTYATTSITTLESITTTNETTTETKLPLLLKESEVILKAGQQYQIEANQNQLTYSSSNTEIAVVSSNGMITALKQGNAVISVINQDYDVIQIKLTVTSDISEPQTELGDLTQDTVIDASDAAQVLVAAARQGSGLDSGLTEGQKKAADINHDNKIDASDAAYILQYAAEKGAGVFFGTLSDFMNPESKISEPDMDAPEV